MALTAAEQADINLARKIAAGLSSGTMTQAEADALVKNLKKTSTGSTTITPVSTTAITPGATTPKSTTPTGTANKVTVPTAITATYTIKSGDTLSAIAAKNNTTVAALMAANPSITNANKIYAGSSIKIPTSTSATTTNTGTAKVTNTGTTNATLNTGATNTGAGTTGTTATGTLGTTSTDATIQKYKDQYAAAQTTGDIQGMINAATAADKYRQSIGQAAINTAQIARLKSEVTTEDQSDSAYQALLDKLNELTNFSETYVPETTKEDYMSEITNYINSILAEQQNTAEANTAKSRATILSDAATSQQGLDDVYTAQLAELAAQADEIRNAYSSGIRNVETTNTDTMDDIAAQAEKILALYEQNKTELGTEKQATLDSLTESIEKIQNAYTASKTNIESEKAETLPTYDKAMNQQDILAQRQAKQLEENFAQRGLQAGGQIASELGQSAQTNLSTIGEISTGKQSYIRDVSNQLSGIEQEKSTSLAGAERQKMQVEQEYANKLNEIDSNKSLSLAEMETLKAQATRDYQNSLADLEQEQASSLKDVARLQSTAAQSLSSSKLAIINKVNAALSNLTIDEQTAIANLAEQRTQMLYEASQSYAEMSDAEKDEAFDQLLKEAGVAGDAVNAIRGFIDDYNKANMDALEYKIKELEYENLSETQKLELKKLEQDMKLGNISAAQVAEQIQLQRDKFEFDKEQTLLENEKEEEKEPTKNEMTASLEGKLDSLSTPEEKLAYIKSIKSDIITYLGKSAYEAYLEEYGG